MQSIPDLLELPESLAWICARARDPDMSRYRLAREVCERFEWRDTRGQLKEMACRKRLAQMHRRNLIELPSIRRCFPQPRPLPSVAVVPIEATLAELGKIELICVTGASLDESRIWQALMKAHPLGGGPLCGAQLRYLIRCERGYLGALAFSAGARRLYTRDAYLGWCDDERAVNLARVVCNSRFLILPEVRVPHLASSILAQATKKMSADWQTHYGYTPWVLETFVDDAHAGTSYRAANWIEVGKTRGRGRQDRHHRCPTTRKKVFIKVLSPQHFPKLDDTLDDTATVDWAVQEFGSIVLEPRLVRRGIEIARDFYACPHANIPQACDTWARTKAAYRFFAHPKTTMQTLLAGHYQATLQRSQDYPVVLAVCDTSSLNYTAHPATEGMGPIGYSKKAVGLMLHETIAFTVSGVPLGLVDVQCWARDSDAFGQKHARKKRSIEEKESRKWLDSWAAVTKAQAISPQTQFVMVADRESDVYDLLAKAKNEQARLLIRAEQSRKLCEEELCLWPYLQTQPVAGELEVQVGRRKAQPARVARLTIRQARVTLLPPKGRKCLGPVAVWAVWAQEIAPPPGIEALDWMLLTTVATDTFSQACERLNWYTKRWGIEIYHRILKSGCNIEDRQLAGADRLEACLAIDMVVAWRIMHLVHLNREVPHLPATVYFDDMQWKALTAFSTRNPIPPKEPPTLNEAVRLVGRLGGHLGRKSDGQPGAEALWIGLQRLDDITETYSIFTTPPPMPPPTG
jgi:hypothetical protein